MKINENGNDLYSKAFTGDVNGTLYREETSLISFNSTDTIELYFEARVEIDSFESAAQSLVRLEWTEASFVNEIGAITNLPAIKEISADI